MAESTERTRAALTQPSWDCWAKAGTALSKFFIGEIIKRFYDLSLLWVRFPALALKQPRWYNSQQVPLQSPWPGLRCPYPAARPHTHTFLSIPGTCPSPPGKETPACFACRGWDNQLTKIRSMNSNSFCPLCSCQLSLRKPQSLLGLCSLVCKIRVIFKLPYLLIAYQNGN